MTLPPDVWHAVFGGSLPGGEVWESGFWIAGAAPTTNAEATGQAEQVWGVITSSDASGAMRITMASIVASGSTLEYAKVYSYPSGGTIAAHIGEFSGTPVGGGRSTILPDQSCCVVSLRSDSSGRRNRGRMYLPGNGNTLTAGADFATADVDAVCAGWATAFSDWNAAGDNGVISVVSRVGGGSHVPVTSCVVDSKPDIQRRRANKKTVAHRASQPVTA